LLRPARDLQPRTRSTGEAPRPPAYFFGSSAERNAVEDFGDDLCSLGDGHSGTIKEEITVRKRNVAVTA
jgi:hypothetical protein